MVREENSSYGRKIHGTGETFMVREENSWYRRNIHGTEGKFMVREKNSWYGGNIYGTGETFMVREENSWYGNKIHGNGGKFMVRGEILSSSPRFYVYPPSPIMKATDHFETSNPFTKLQDFIDPFIRMQTPRSVAYLNPFSQAVLQQT